jgi:integrase
MPALKLRQDLVRSIPYQGPGGKHQCVYWDESLECFGLRVYPSGRRVYVCSYRVRGRKRLASLGRADVLTLDQARKKATAYLGKVAGNEDPQDESEAQRKLKTVEELCGAYVENHAKKKKMSWKDDESCLRRRVLPKLKSRVAATVVTADIEAIHSEVGTDHPYAANRILEVVRKMYNWGKVAGLVPKDQANPAVGIVRFRERKRKRFIATVEMPRFVQALEEEENDYARHGLWLLILLGVRMRELLKAKWEDIDCDMRTLLIGLTKNGEPLLAPLSDAAIARLKMIPRMANNPYIICGMKPGRPLSGLRTALQRVLKRSGLVNIRIHDLRRTVGSWLAQSGHSLHLIGDVLNHRDPKTTAGYAYFQTQQRCDALTSHADKVLTLAAPHLRSGTERQAQRVEDYLPARDLQALTAAAPQPLRRAHYLAREDLYKLVWTSPVSEVAVRFGISDVGLAKICGRSNIPVPGRGHWASVETGGPMKQPILPPAPAGSPQLIRIRGRKPLPEATAMAA